MKKLKLLLALLSLATLSHAQPTFEMTVGNTSLDRGYDVIQTSDGGFVVTGSYSVPQAAFSETYLAKVDSTGNLLWTQTYGGSSNDDGRSVQQTADGGYIIAGNTSSFGAGAKDIYLIKTDAVGNWVWTKTYGSATEDVGFFVQQTTDGGYILTGKVAFDMCLIKTNSTGDTLWTKTFGGFSADQGFCVRQTLDGGYILAGRTPNFGAGSDDVLVVRTDAGGNLLWAKAYGGPDTEGCSSIQQTSDSGYIFVGYTFSFGPGLASVYLVKTDSSGNVDWEKTFGGSDSQYGQMVQETFDGGYVVAGYTNSFGAGNWDGYLIRTDANGDLSWSRTVGGTSSDYTVNGQQTSDGGFIFGGYSSSFGAGDFDVYLIKTDSMGNADCHGQSVQTLTVNPATQITNLPAITTSQPVITTTPGTVADTGGVTGLPCILDGILEKAVAGSFSLAPNPTAGAFTLSWEEEIKKGSVEIYGAYGDCIWFENISASGMMEIQLPDVLNGFYFVRLNDGIKSYVQKLIVVKD